MGTVFVLAYSINNGCSSRHVTHHEAQTFRIQTLPRISAPENVFAGSFNCGRVNAGAALLINGEGTSCGSWFNPIARKTTNPKKSTNGIRYLIMTVPLQLQQTLRPKQGCLQLFQTSFWLRAAF